MINCKGKLIDLSTPKVMGILNVTPDSFFDGGKYTAMDAILFQAEKMLSEGADFIDIGGMSSKPGASIISAEDEIQRVLPALEAILKRFPETIISIDTVHAKTAQETIAAGAAIINDISAGEMDKNMISTVAKLQVPYILMHMKGTPETMQQQPSYENVSKEVIRFLLQKINHCRESGIKDLIIDPGFGFGKTTEHNFQLLKNLKSFEILGVPILCGLSRKSMINKILGISAKDSLNGTTALNTLALLNGANILRVHDVKEAKEAIQLVEYYHSISLF
jgi:dihydropteroate synthase